MKTAYISIINLIFYEIIFVGAAKGEHRWFIEKFQECGVPKHQMIIQSPPKDEEEIKRWLCEAGLPLCLQVNKNLECLVLQPCHLVSLSWFIVHQDLVKPWQMSLVVQHPLWSQRISVSGPRQLRWSGTRLGQYGLKRLICCRKITIRSTRLGEMVWRSCQGDA